MLFIHAKDDPWVPYITTLNLRGNFIDKFTIFITDLLISIFGNRNVFLFPIRKFSFLLLNNFLFIRKLVLNQMTKSLIYSSIK